MFKQKGIAVTIGAALISASVYADEVDTITIYSTDSELYTDVLPSVTVITSEDIELSQAQDLFEVIANTAGVEVAKNGGLGAIGSLFLRGQNSNSVAIYVDDIRVAADSFGSLSRNTSLPPAQSVDRVEIVRGNSSAITGESAIGGAIYIYTRQYAQDATETSVSVTAGADETKELILTTGGTAGDFGYGLSATVTDSDGFPTVDSSQFDTASNETGGYSSQSLSATVSYNINDVTVGARLYQIDSEFDYNDTDFFGSYIDQVVRMTTDNLDYSAYAKYSHDALDLSYTISRNDVEYSFDVLGDITSTGTFASPSDFVTTTHLLGADYAVSDNYVISASVSDSDQELTVDGSLTRDSRNLSLSNRWLFGALNLQLSLSHDDITVTNQNAATVSQASQTTNDFSESNYLVGAGYQISDQLELTVTNSTAFRAPAVSEYFPGAFCGVSFSESCFNPNLKPETHETSELGLRYASGNLTSRLVYFDTETTDAITFVGMVNNGYGNVPTLTNSGVELSLRYQWDGYSVISAYTIQDPEDVNSSSPLLRRAKQFGTLTFNKQFNDLSLGAKLTYSKERNDFDFISFSPQTLGSYTVVDLHGSYRLSESLLLRAKIKNVFDEQYQHAYGFNTQDRSFWLTLEYRTQ